jgi:hypothetical protein
MNKEQCCVSSSIEAGDLSRQAGDMEMSAKPEISAQRRDEKARDPGSRCASSACSASYERNPAYPIPIDRSGFFVPSPHPAGWKARHNARKA